MFRCYLLSLLFKSFSPILSKKLENYEVEETFEKYGVDLLDKCFSDSLPMVIVGSMISHSKQNGLFQLIAKKPIYLLGVKKNEMEESKNKTIVFTPEKYYFASIAATKFVVVITDARTLQTKLSKLKNSVFWNIYGYYLIMNVENCRFIYSHLKMIWEFDILNAVYQCHHPVHGVCFYIFNPFNEEAPKSWKKIGSVFQKNNHPMTVFRKLAKSESENVTNCQDFLFEKVKNLSGYPIKVAEVNEYINVTNKWGKVREKSIFELSQKKMRVIWSQMKASVDYVPVSQEELGSLNSDGSSNGVVSQVLQGIYECRSDVDYFRGFWRHEVNMFTSDGICYITRKDSIPISMQLVQAFPLKFYIVYFICFGIASCIYVYLIKDDAAEMALDIFRAVLGQCMIFKPQDKLSSLIFCVIVFTSMIITMQLQSLLNAIVTTSLSVGKDISSSDDVIKYNLRAYGDPYYNQYFIGTLLEDKISPVTGIIECLEMMRKDSNVACVDACFVTGFCVQEGDEIHISKDEMFFMYSCVFFFRDDSPFTQKFQWIASILLENGIIYYMDSSERNQYRKMYTRVHTIIKIEQLRPAFFILYPLLILSLISFFVELSNQYFRRKFNLIRHIMLLFDEIYFYA